MKNIYRFSTLTAVACLGLGLMTAGCADHGGGTMFFPYNPAPAPAPTPEPSPTSSPEPSPTPAPEPSPAPSPEPSPSPTPLGDKATLKIEFPIVTARAEVPLEVTAYNFRLNIGEEESQAEEGIEKKADDDNPNLQTVIFEDVDPNVDNVSVEYLNEEGKVVAMSEFPVELTAGQETVADDFETQEASRLIVKNSADYVLVGEDISLTASVVYGDEFSEDCIEREVSNDDMTYELHPARNYGSFEPKEGENGTFTAGAANPSWLLATYAENIQALHVVGALEEDEEITGYLFTNNGYVWINILCQWEPGNDDFIPMLYAPNPLPDNITRPCYLEPCNMNVLGTNEAIAILWGKTAEEHMVPLTAEWSGEGDYLQVSGSGQAGFVRVSGAGTDGTITATIGEGENKQEISMPFKALEAKTAIGPVERHEYEANPHFAYSYGLHEELQPGGSFRIYPGGEYFVNGEDKNFYDHFYVGTSDNTITWSLAEGSAETITIDETGLVTASETAQDGDEGYPLFTVNGFTPDVEENPGYIVVVEQ